MPGLASRASPDPTRSRCVPTLSHPSASGRFFRAEPFGAHADVRLRTPRGSARPVRPHRTSPRKMRGGGASAGPAHCAQDDRSAAQVEPRPGLRRPRQLGACCHAHSAMPRRPRNHRRCMLGKAAFATGRRWRSAFEPPCSALPVAIAAAATGTSIGRRQSVVRAGHADTQLQACDCRKNTSPLSGSALRPTCYPQSTPKRR